MPGKAGFFLLGCWWLQRAAVLPAWGAVALVAGMALLLAVVLRDRNGSTWLLWALAGWLIAATQARVNWPPALPWPVERADWQAEWVIERLPVVRQGITRLVVRIDWLERQGEAQHGDWRVRLSWRSAPPLKVGQRWRTTLRLRPAHGHRNAGSWDYAGWLYRQGIRYRGYVSRGERQLLGEAACCWLERLRQGWREALLAHTREGAGQALLLALTLGDRSGIDHAMRQVLQRTGTSHLLAISGLHIGLIAALAGGLAGWIWRRTPACRRIPARLVAVSLGLAFATAYALVSGFGVPARRALLMLAVSAWLLWRRERMTLPDAFSVVLLVVLASEPTALLDAGFWLSFVAVAAILAMLPHLRGRSAWRQWLGVQLGISLALYPVLLAFDMPPAALSVPVNLLLVPVFSLLLMPALLLSLALSGWTDLPLLGVQALLEWLWTALQQAAVLATPFPRPPGEPATIALLSLAVLALLAPPGWRLRWPGLLLLLALHLPRVPDLANGDFEIDVLDVGQGLSVVVRTAGHRLIYDTGPAYPGGFNLADAVVLPWLHHHGVTAIDRLVLSHGDRDHAGAAAALVRGIRVDEVLSGEPRRVAVPARRCLAGEHWAWDGVSFRFIQPPWAARRRGNNASCVLAIEGQGRRVLLMGDAETAVEQALLPWARSRAPFDLVVAGHHGSTTSSSEAFVKAVSARHVVYTAGYRNRYRFPRSEIDRRWAAVGAVRWRTDGCGSLHIRLAAGAMTIVPRTQEHRRYWQVRDVACRRSPP